ncbi:MAG: amino acid ABC transporter permease [Actinobacteria bacterium]|nr:amino acid ABC transporter permease [Actinomycetota bacterium]
MKSVPAVLLWSWLALVAALVVVICVLSVRMLRTRQRRAVLMALGNGLLVLAAGVLISVLKETTAINKFLNEFLNWDIFVKTWRYVIKGLVVTIELAVVAEVFILILGLIVALIRISRIQVFRITAAVYIDVIRGMPLILQIFVIYFGLGYLGLNLSRFMAGVLALTICYAAYEAEIFRAGIESIHKGQMEAARSLGMGYFKAMRYVVLPQAVRNVIPPLSNEFIALLKDTALVALIGLAEVFFRGKEMMGRYANITPLVFAGICYLIVTIPLMRLVQRMTNRLTIGD